MHPVTEWTCELVDGPDKGKVIFSRGPEPPGEIHPPRHLSPSPKWGGLEDPYHYAPMPFRTYTLTDTDRSRRRAKYEFVEDK